MLLGERRDLPPAVRRHAVATGTAHLFALSGLHVVLVAGLLGRLARAALGSGPSTRVVQGLLLAIFGGLAGLRPPLLRATLGWWLLAWCWHAGRRADGLHRLGVVALVLLVTVPGVQHDVSAQLSFAAVAGLLALARGRRGALAWMLAPAGAFLATAPLAAELFGRVQPWGVAVTPLLLPWVAGRLALGLPCILTGDLTAPLDGVTGPALGFLAGGLERTLEELAVRLPPPWHPPPPPLPGWLLSTLVVAALWVLTRRAPGARPSAHPPSTSPVEQLP